MSIAVFLSSAAVVVDSGRVAVAQTPGGMFTCRSSAANAFGLEPVVANPVRLPCAEDSRTALDLPAGSLVVRSPSARTQLLPAGRGATSLTQLAGVELSLLGLRAEAVEAEATVACVGGQPRLSATSKVIGLTVNGRAVPAGERADIPLTSGTLHLNRTVEQSGELTVRALELTTPLGTVILGEARVGSTGNPCPGGDRGTGTITVVKVAEPEEPQDFPFGGDLGPFSLRDDGTSTAADRRTFSKPPGLYRIAEGDPTGGRFFFAWFLRDVRCVDPDGQTTTDRNDQSVRVDLDPGENVVCTFTNRNNPALALTDGDDIVNPARGLDPVADKQGAPPPPVSPGGIQVPTPRTIPAAPAAPAVDPPPGTSASILSSRTLVALPLVALLAGGIWLLLAVGRRRRDEPA